MRRTAATTRLSARPFFLPSLAVAGRSFGTRSTPLGAFRGTASSSLRNGFLWSSSSTRSAWLGTPTRSNALVLRRTYATPGGKGTGKQEWQQRNKNVGMILTTLILGGIAISYASVPLYQRFCAVTGYGGTTRKADESRMSSPDRWKTRPERPLTVKFYSNTNSNIPWVFYPLQNEVRLVPGESTLAFYRAENPSPEDIVGIASYNVVPAKAGIYFQKIQCFCFEEQLLPAKKGVDMPVYFVIDPDFVDDPNMHDVESISLFYTFFRAVDFDDLNAKAYDEQQQQQQEVAKKEEAQT